MKLNGIIVALCSVGILNAHAENVSIAKSSLGGDGIVEFVPQGFDQTKTPSLFLKKNPRQKGLYPPIGNYIHNSPSWTERPMPHWA